MFLSSACSERVDNGADAIDTVSVTGRAIVRQARPVSVAIDSTVTKEPGLPARGSSYEVMVANRMLPDEAPARSVSLAPNDTIDTANYQAAGWWLIINDSSARGRSRFSADFERFTSGVLVIRLDTLLVRDQQRPPFHSERADSIAVGGLRETERLATHCRMSGYQRDDRILGLMPDSSSERWLAPRMAWFVDTLASRIRRIRSDGLDCWLAANPD